MASRELYYKRRIGAIDFWQRVPQQVVNYNHWFDEDSYTGCALGWMGRSQYDGWQLKTTDINDPYEMPVFEEHFGYEGAAYYFGLSLAETVACFDPVKSFHHKWWQRRIVTLNDIGVKLLSLPYNEEK